MSMQAVVTTSRRRIGMRIWNSSAPRLWREGPCPVVSGGVGLDATAATVVVRATAAALTVVVQALAGEAADAAVLRAEGLAHAAGVEVDALVLVPPAVAVRAEPPLGRVVAVPLVVAVAAVSLLAGRRPAALEQPEDVLAAGQQHGRDRERDDQRRDEHDHHDGALHHHSPGPPFGGTHYDTVLGMESKDFEKLFLSTLAAITQAIIFEICRRLTFFSLPARGNQHYCPG